MKLHLALLPLLALALHAQTGGRPMQATGPFDVTILPSLGLRLYQGCAAALAARYAVWKSFTHDMPAFTFESSVLVE